MAKHPPRDHDTDGDPFLSGRLLAAWRSVFASYWALPAGIILGGITLSVGLTGLDRWISAEESPNLPFVIGPTTADGAKGILETVGGSMLAVAGVVFSITLATIVFASGQYGPHVIPQYQRDRRAQATLGAMLGAFAYCMVALYVTQAGEDAFIPTLTVLGALLFGGAGLMLLVTFINHMLTMLHVSNVVARIGGKARRLMESDMPTEEDEEDTDPLRPRAAGHDVPYLTEEGDPLLRSGGSGYVLTIGTKPLVRLAAEHDLTFDLLVRPGDFVTPLTPVLRSATPLTGEQREAACAAFAFGARRTPDEDTAFLLDELCAIGLRALSPGINDPFTATDVIYQLSSLVERAARGQTRDPVHRDEEGTPRLRRSVLTFGDVLRLSFDRMAESASTNATIAPIMLEAYDRLLCTLAPGPGMDALRTSAKRYVALCAENQPSEDAKERVATAARRMLRASHDLGRGEQAILRIDRQRTAAP